MRRIGLIWIIALVVFGAFSGKARQDYRINLLKISGTARDRIICDLNGDGLEDLAVIFTRAIEEEQSHLGIFYQKPDSTFSSQPNQDLILDKNIRTIDCGEVAPDKGKELVVFKDEGVFYFEKAGAGKLKALINTPTIFNSARYHFPLHHRFLWDFDGDGIDEIIMPEISGPKIYQQKGYSGYKLLQKVPLPARLNYKIGSWGDITITDDINQFLRFRTYLKRTSATYTVPDLFVEDFNGDKKPDLIGILGNNLWVFCQTEGGRVSEKPCLDFHRSVLTQQEKKLGFITEMLTFADLNGDGLGDIIKVKYGSLQQRVNIQYMIFYARPGLKYSNEPDQKLSSSGFRADFGVYDLNQDGKKDIVIPYFHFAPAQAFKVLTDNAVKIQFRIYLMGKNGRYAQDPDKEFARPDRRELLVYRINILGMILDPEALIKGEINPLIHFGADVNGDGYPDLVADSGADTLNIYYGNKQVNFSQTPDQSFGFESSWAFDFADLNHDRKEDLITYYESEERVKEKKKAMEEMRAQASQRASQSGLSEEEELLKIIQAKEETRIRVLIWK